MPSGLYVHVPFCSRKCPYCDFYSVGALDLIPSWLEGTAREAALAGPGFLDSCGPFDTLYLGGGSPSLLTRADLRALLASLAPLLGAASLKEATIEANPDDVTADKALFWKEAGFTRVSLGAQSFDARWLHASLERSHTPAETFAAIEAVAKSGLNLSLDLIYGHPGQKPEEWAGDLDKAASGPARHISAYMLSAPPGTPLGRAVADGVVKLPGEKMYAELFEVTGQALELRGFSRYEVSNHALEGFECLHNLKYWRREPYLGLGPSAHSFDGQRRLASVPSVRRWASALSRGERALAVSEVVTEEMARLEAVMLGLRMAEGLERSLVASSPKLGG
ncbi:MAG: radical SAM family heme chaperone HemW, partial [Deltaproteobacteria bacterium]|nr:radical SAM family heme chaperone HemW [Deltaproteobacteria bacterium]